jgi:hypothetical protein
MHFLRAAVRYKITGKKRNEDIREEMKIIYMNTTTKNYIKEGLESPGNNVCPKNVSLRCSADINRMAEYTRDVREKYINNSSNSSKRNRPRPSSAILL